MLLLICQLSNIRKQKDTLNRLKHKLSQKTLHCVLKQLNIRSMISRNFEGEQCINLKLLLNKILTHMPQP